MAFYVAIHMADLSAHAQGSSLAVNKNRGSLQSAPLQIWEENGGSFAERGLTVIWFGGTALSPGATADVVEEHGQLVRRSMDNVRRMHPERHVDPCLMKSLPALSACVTPCT